MDALFLPGDAPRDERNLQFKRMPKLVLLKTEADFATFRSSRTFQTPELRIKVSSQNQNVPRFGFIVPKKVLPKVTDRNKVKRRIKAVLIKHLNRSKPVGVLFFPNQKTLKLEFMNLEKNILELFSKA